MFYPVPKTLQTITAVAVSTNGTAYIPVPKEDAESNAITKVRALFYLDQSGGSSSPTSKLKIQTSVDAVYWADVVESSTLTTTDSLCEESPEIAIGPYVRSALVLSGGVAPTCTGYVCLICTAPLDLVS